MNSAQAGSAAVAAPGQHGGWRVVAAVKSGASHVWYTGRYVVAAYLCNLVLAVILGSMLHGAIKTSLGSSMAGDRMREGFDSLWYNSFSSQATGVAATFRPSVTGIGAVFDAVDGFLDGFEDVIAAGAASGVLPVALLYWLLWSFLAGGFLSAYASPDAPPAFAAGACRWFSGIASLTLAATIFYWLVLGVVRPWLGALVYSATRDTIDERALFAATAARYAFVWVLIWSGNMLFDYAKIALVSRGRPGPIASIAAFREATHVIRRRWTAAATLYAALGSIWVAGTLCYWVVVPGAGQSSVLALAGTFVLGQLFILSRIGTRCLFYASETAVRRAPQRTTRSVACEEQRAAS